MIISATPPPQINRDRAHFSPEAPAPLEEIRDVAILPVFDPAVGGVMVMASIALAAGAQSPTPAALSPALTATLGDRHADIHYSLSMSGLTSTGRLGSTSSDNVSEKLEADGDQQAHLTGRVGDAAEDLTIAAAEDGFHVTGTVGSTAVDLTYGLQPGASEAPGSEGQYAWACVQGTIGGSAYSATASLTPPIDNGDLGAILVRGSLGDETISKAYRVTSDPGAGTLTIDGQGVLAGKPQNVRLVMDLEGAAAFQGSFH